MKKFLTFLLSGIFFCAVVFLGGCNNAKNFQMTKEEYEKAFTLEMFSNVTATFTSLYGENEQRKEYLYSEGDSYALCKYREKIQYYGIYYGVKNGEEFAYIYGTEYADDFTEQQAVWKKSNSPSYYKTEGANTLLYYKQEFNVLKYDKKTKSYKYVNTAYGDEIKYTYYFVDKKLAKFEMEVGEEKEHFIGEFSNYGATNIPIEIKNMA